MKLRLEIAAATAAALVLTLVGCVIPVGNKADWNQSGLSVQPGATDLPTADEVLDNYVKAVGGREALQKVTSRVMKGVVKGPTNAVVEGSWLFDAIVAGGAAGLYRSGRSPFPPPLPSTGLKMERRILQTFELQAKAPSKRLTRIEARFADMPTDDKPAVDLAGFNGAVGWTKNFASHGPRQEKDEDLEKMRRDSDFCREIRLNQIYPDLRMEGKAMVNGEGVYVLKSNPSPKSLERFAFSTQTGLLLWQESEYVTVPYDFAWRARPRIRVRVEYSDYQTLDEVKVPATWRCTAGPASGGPTLEHTFKATEIKHNVPVEDALFEMPVK